MTMTNHNNRKHDQIILSTIEQLVPQEHLVRKLEATIDWKFIYPLVKELYSPNGRPSIDPVVLFKMIFINYTFGINSMRRTCEEIQVNVAYRWFLGISMEESVPNYSTWSQNYSRRYGDSKVFDEIFSRIIRQAMHYGYIDTETIYGDSTHQKASANKRKSESREVELVQRYYEEDLKEEINRDRESKGKKPLKEIRKSELSYDEETGEVIENKETKRIKESTTDRECGLYHKGEKEKCFAYSHQAMCDKNGFVIAHVTVAGNVHDSVSFKGVYDKVKENYEGIKNIGLDSGYKTPAIAREIIESGHKPYLPYKRPMTKEGFFKKSEYSYEAEYDIYLCPNGKALSYTTTNKDGYKEYKSIAQICKQCEWREKCTKSKNTTKLVTRHVWEEYMEEVEEIRHEKDYKDIYGKRKETIERVFADCKESHGLRYTRLRGIKKNQHQALIIFGCHNLKKMASWRWKYTTSSSANPFNFKFYKKFILDFKQKVILLLESTTLSTN